MNSFSLVSLSIAPVLFEKLISLKVPKIRTAKTVSNCNIPLGYNEWMIVLVRVRILKGYRAVTSGNVDDVYQIMLKININCKI